MVFGIARGRLNIRFGHCTSCLFDNSSVKLCKHDTPLLFAPSGANHEQGLGKGHGCEAMKAPVGLSSGSAVCDSRWRGLAPTSSVEFVTESVKVYKVRQDGFANFIVIKR